MAIDGVTQLGFTTKIGLDTLIASEEPLNVTVTTDALSVGNFNHVMFYCQFVRDAATELQFFVDVSNDAQNWYPYQGPEAASVAPVYSISVTEFTRAVSTDENIPIPMPMGTDFVRMRITSTAGTADDLITVIARGAYL